MANPSTRIVNQAVRGVGNVVYYVQRIEKLGKDTKYHDGGFAVHIKNVNRDKNPFPFDHCPSDEELRKLWSWR
jgi:hypothetical protein